MTTASEILATQARAKNSANDDDLRGNFFLGIEFDADDVALVFQTRHYSADSDLKAGRKVRNPKILCRFALSREKAQRLAQILHHAYNLPIEEGGAVLRKAT